MTSTPKHSARRHPLRILLVCVLLALVVALAALLTLFQGELRTLMTVEKQREYPLYTMNYLGDYGFDKYLAEGSASDAELIAFVTRTLLKGIPLPFSIPDLGCSTFNAVTPEGEAIFGRNFDLSYSPALLVRTQPKNGYASLSMVNMGFLGYGEGKLPDSLLSSFILLAAPYAPLDGVNEKGVSIGVLLIPTEPTAQETGKTPISTTAAVRLVLDKAASVDEAIDLLSRYDMHASAGSSYHFQIADAQGHSAVVEFEGDVMSVVRADTPYQACTNFLQTPAYYGQGKGLERYDLLVQTLAEKGGVLTMEEGMALLSAVSQPFEDVTSDSDTQWSVMYNNATGEAVVCAGRDYENPYFTSL